MPRVIVVLGLLYPTHVTVWRAARNSGVDVHLAGALQGPNLETHQPAPQKFEDIPTHDLEVRGPSFLTERGLQWWWLDGLQRTVERVRPDLIHVVSEVWGVMATECLRTGIPTIIHSWDNLYRHGNSVEDFVRLALARRNLRRSAGHVCASSAGIQLARNHGLPSTAPVAVAAPVVPDPTRFSPSPAGTDEIVVGFVGRLVSQKGVSWLIEAFGRIEREARLVVCGDGPERRSLETLARQHGINVTFHGSVHYEEIPDMMRSLDVLVVPSLSTPDWEEQYGRVAVEAMLTGRPVVTSSSGALPEVVGPAGIVVPEGDVELLGRTLSKLIARPEQLRKLGASARTYALRNHAPDVVADRIVDVWAEAAT